MYNNMLELFELEKYMPVMSPAELRDYEQAITGKAQADFSPDTVIRWEVLLRARNNEINARFKAANAKSNELCKMQKG